MKQPYLTVRRSISPAKGMGPIYVFDSNFDESEKRELLEQCMEALGQVFGKRAARAAARKCHR